MIPEQSNAAVMIGVLGGNDPVVGPLLASLLVTAGYVVRLFGEDEPEESLSECGLLLFAPGVSLARRQTFLGSLGDGPRAPILELVKSLDGVEARAVEYRNSPPLLEELKRGIEAALFGTTGASEGGRK